MIRRLTPVFAAAALLALPVHAQLPGEGHIPGQGRPAITPNQPGGADTSMSRQHAAPEGNTLARPSNPNTQPQGPVMQPQVSPEQSNAATNAITTIGPGSIGQRGEVRTQQPPGAILTAPELGVPQQGGTLPAQPTRQPLSPTGTMGGGETGANQIKAEDLNGMTIHLQDGKDFGRVTGVVVNLERGTIDQLQFSEGGTFDLQPGEPVFAVPWQQVGWVDRNQEAIQLNVARAQLEPATAGQTRQQANPPAQQGSTR
ncbi:MAG TPA: PRC-barrel domain-containing protein [Azospirillaceae bacterium]|nr:PRC-barrel domain-containing protein [Azospirillaceae bacterium]